MSDDDHEMAEPAPVEIGDVLDLHTFRPRDVPELVRDYVDECVARGYAEVRIIHGKGIGNLRRTVHAVLERHPDVVEYRLGGQGGGSWGATVATLRAR